MSHLLCAAGFSQSKGRVYGQCGGNLPDASSPFNHMAAHKRAQRLIIEATRPLLTRANQRGVNHSANPLELAGRGDFDLIRVEYSLVTTITTNDRVEWATMGEMTTGRQWASPLASPTAITAPNATLDGLQNQSRCSLSGWCLPRRGVPVFTPIIHKTNSFDNSDCNTSWCLPDNALIG